MRKLSLMITALALLPAVLWGQEPRSLRGEAGDPTNVVVVQDYGLGISGGKTLLSMDFVLDSLRVPSNRYRAYTPVLVSEDGQYQQRLKTLIVSGRTQNIVFERDGIDALYADNCENVRRQNGTAQRHSYSDVVDTRPWHSSATVKVECDLCGCGDQKRSELVSLFERHPEVAGRQSMWDFADVEPAAVKPTLNLHGTAYVTFVVDRWEVKPDYMNNPRELRKITDTLDVMVADRNITVRQIKIHGWASPESPYDHNAMLAQNRAQSLTDYVRRLYGLPVGVFAPAESTPENWEGLRRAVEELDAQVLPHREQILALIGNPSLAPDPKEWKLKTTYPAEYKYLLTTVYPYLRRSDYEIQFDIREFTLSEALEVYETKPYQLSLHELWEVANSFGAGSDGYARVWETANIYYPDSVVAIVNAAHAALRCVPDPDVAKAERLISRAAETAASCNVRAIVSAERGRLAEAESWLDKAESLGLDAGIVAQNRECLRELREQNEQDRTRE